MSTFTKTTAETFHIIACASCGSRFDWYIKTGRTDFTMYSTRAAAEAALAARKERNP